MFYKVKTRVSLKANINKMKKYLKGSTLNEEDRISLAKETLSSQISRYFHRECGVFIDSFNFSNLKICGDPSTYEIIDLSFDCEMYFYKCFLKEIVDYKITNVYPYKVEGVSYKARFQTQKDLLSNLLLVYSPSTNSFEIGEKEKIKEGDFLRAKVTSLNLQQYYFNSEYKVKTSCRNQGTGKITLK